MAVTEQTPRNVSTAAAGATVFPYSFKILDKRDLLVQVDGVTRTVDVHYTVSGVGLDGGGNITFLTPLAGGQSVMRRRNMKLERLTDYQNLGDLRSPTLNNDQDAPVMMIQQLADDVARSFRISPGYPGNVSLDLPAPEPGRLIGWNPGADALRNVDPSGPADLLLRTDLADPASGSGLVAFRQNGAGAILRTAAAKLAEHISVRDFGALGNGGTDDTAAFEAALKFISLGGGELYVPAGAYIISRRLLVPRVAGGYQVKIRGDGPTLTRIIAAPGFSGSMLQIGAPAELPGYNDSVWISDVGIVGAGTGVTGSAITLFNVVHSSIERVYVSQCYIGISLLGCIANDIQNCTIWGNAQGILATKFDTGANLGYVNFNNIVNCEIKNNSVWGIEFDFGTMLNVVQCDIEANGTTGQANTGAIRVGANIEEEYAATTPPALQMTDCWLESNMGGATIVLESGLSNLTRCIIVANTFADYDLWVKGGMYHLRDCNFGSVKVSNLREDNVPAVKVGNTITGTQFAGGTEISIFKTSIVPGALAVKSADMLNMTIETGQVGTTPSTIDVVFPKPFSPGSVPQIFTQIRLGKASAIDQVEVQNPSATGFRLVKKSTSGGTVSPGVFAVSWVAIGQRNAP